MTRANILRTGFGVAIAFGLIFDQPDVRGRPVADAAEAAAVIEAAVMAGEADGAVRVETVSVRADACAAHPGETDAAAAQREL